MEEEIMLISLDAEGMKKGSTSCGKYGWGMWGPCKGHTW